MLNHIIGQLILSPFVQIGITGLFDGVECQRVNMGDVQSSLSSVSFSFLWNRRCNIAWIAEEITSDFLEAILVIPSWSKVPISFMNKFPEFPINNFFKRNPPASPSAVPERFSLIDEEENESNSLRLALIIFIGRRLA